LQGRNNLACVRQQKLERRQLLGREVNRLFSAEKRAIGFQPKACK
jgi:hypothetical protein